MEDFPLFIQTTIVDIKLALYYNIFLSQQITQGYQLYQYDCQANQNLRFNIFQIFQPIKYLCFLFCLRRKQKHFIYLLIYPTFLCHKSLQQILMKQKYCLQSVLPFDSINKSQINKSKAKQTFSFSKSPRFQQATPTCPVVSYCGQQLQRKNSGPGIGYGKKYDLAQDASQAPSSQIYRIRSLFEDNQIRRKGYSMKYSREQLPSYLNKESLKVPAAGKYHRQTRRMATEQSAPIYSMRPRTRVINKLFSIESQNDNPSPDHYPNNPEQTTQSVARKYKSITYTNCRSKRFDTYDNRVPGPGKYEGTGSNLSNIGSRIVSPSSGCAKFLNSKRTTEFDDAAKKGPGIPGPGSYRLGSQFGQYDGDVYGRQHSSSRIRSKHI